MYNMLTFYDLKMKNGRNGKMARPPIGAEIKTTEGMTAKVLKELEKLGAKLRA